MPFGYRPPAAFQADAAMAAEESAPMGGIPPAFLSALAGLQQPTPEPVPNVSIPGMILSSALATLGGALSGRPETAGPAAVEPLVQRRAVQERNQAAQSQYEGQRAALLRQGAVEGEESRRAEAVAGQRAESAAEVADIRAEQQRASEQERTARATEVANIRAETQNAIASASNRLREIELSIKQQAADTSAGLRASSAALKDAQTALAKARAKEVEGRTARLTGDDLKEIRQFSRDILGQAVSTLKATPEGEEPTLTIEFSSGPQEFVGAEEIRDGILGYLDAATRGSKEHDKLLGEAQRALAEALGETRGGSLAE